MYLGGLQADSNLTTGIIIWFRTTISENWQNVLYIPLLKLHSHHGSDDYYHSLSVEILINIQFIKIHDWSPLEMKFFQISNSVFMLQT